MTPCCVQERPDWDTAKRVLGNPKFIERLVGYDANNIPASICEALARVVEDPRFTPDQARPISHTNCLHVCI